MPAISMIASNGIVGQSTLQYNLIASDPFVSIALRLQIFSFLYCIVVKLDIAFNSVISNDTNSLHLSVYVNNLYNSIYWVNPSSTKFSSTLHFNLSKFLLFYNNLIIIFYNLIFFDNKCFYQII